MGMGPSINGWQMDLVQIQAIVNNTVTEAGQVAALWEEQDVNSVLECQYVTNGGEVLGPALATALALLMSSQSIEVGNIGKYMYAGAMGVSAAATEYSKSDTGMAAAAQTQMKESVKTGSFDYFLDRYQWK